MPSNRRLQSPPGRTGSLARGSYNFRKRSLRRSRCEHGGVATCIFMGASLFTASLMAATLARLALYCSVSIRFVLVRVQV